MLWVKKGIFCGVALLWGEAVFYNLSRFLKIWGAIGVKETELSGNQVPYRPSIIVLLGLVVSLGLLWMVLGPCVSVSTLENDVQNQSTSGKLLYQVAVDEPQVDPNASTERVQGLMIPKRLLPQPNDMVMPVQPILNHRQPGSVQPQPPTP